MTTPTNLLEIPEELIEQWNLDWIYQNKCVGSITSYMAKRGAEWAVQQTAEECARVCENERDPWAHMSYDSAIQDCAQAIRTKYQLSEKTT